MDKFEEILQLKLKENIEILINNNKLDLAIELINDYKVIEEKDIEMISMEGITYILQNNIEYAIEVLKKGYEIDNNNFDISYNLGYAYSMKGENQEATYYYQKALELCSDEDIAKNIRSTFIELNKPSVVTKMRKKIAFFCKVGMDSFLGDIINELSLEYDVEKILVNDYKQIDEGMAWADICWFEWCDELIVYGSNNYLAHEKRIICRLHSYEAFTDYPDKVKWEIVDKLIFVAEHIKDHVLSKVNIDNNKISVIANGIDLDKFTFKERKKGFNIAYVGYINYKKGPMLLLQTFKAIYDIDNRYKLYIAGQFQDERDVLYFKQMIKEFGLEKNLFYQGWQEDLNNWLEDKNYILCTSILESQNISVMEAMTKGIKPLIHNFVGCRNIYHDKYVWNDFNEVINLIKESEYNSKQYREYISSKYSLRYQLNSIRKEIEDSSVKITEYNENIINQLHELIPYETIYINEFNFYNCKILYGKVEKVDPNLLILDVMLSTENNKRILISAVKYQVDINMIILPNVYQKSDKSTEIIKIIRQVLGYELTFKNNIASFYFEKELVNDINNNYLAYIWERGIPGTEFMPINGLRIISNRYSFVKRFIEKGMRILEAPCSFGYGAAYLSKFVDRNVEAVDIASDCIEFASKAYAGNKVNWTQGDVTKLNYGDNTFDVYVSYEVFEHLTLEQIDDYLKEASRVVKNNGKFIISTPNYSNRKHVNNPFHIKEYTFEEFNNILKKYYSNIEYFSLEDYRVHNGITPKSISMMAVCTK